MSLVVMSLMTACDCERRVTAISPTRLPISPTRTKAATSLVAVRRSRYADSGVRLRATGVELSDMVRAFRGGCSGKGAASGRGAGGDREVGVEHEHQLVV